MKELKKSLQIEILKGAVVYLAQDSMQCGCCSAIIKAGYNLNVNSVCGDLKILIPSFNRENAIRLAKIKKFRKPDLLTSYWWESRHYMKVRIRFLNYLISELESTMYF